MPRQESLFKRESPLRSKISKEFFQNLPTEPGVYRFLDEGGGLLYVGKAKNLKNRIQSYLQIKDSTRSRKLWVLVNKVSKIEFETQPDEVKALLRENALLRNLKPRFNRLNTYPENYSYLAFELTSKNEHHTRFRIHWITEAQLQESPSNKKFVWIFGAYKGRRRVTEVCGLLNRLFIAMNDQLELSRSSRFFKSYFTFPLEMQIPKPSVPLVKKFFVGESPKLLKELCLFFADSANDLDCWLRLSIESDLKFLKEFYELIARRQKRVRNKFLISTKVKHIPALMIDDLIVMEAFGLQEALLSPGSKSA